MAEFRAIEIPAIEECPECESIALRSTALKHECVDVTLDGSGGIRSMKSEYPYDSYVIELICRECQVILVEDGEVVHEDIDQ